VTRDGRSGDWAESPPPRRSGRHSRPPQDDGGAGRAAPDPYAQSGPYPARGPYADPDPLAATGSNGQTGPYAPAGSAGVRGRHGGGASYPPPGPGAGPAPYAGQQGPGAGAGPGRQAEGQSRRGRYDDPDGYAGTGPHSPSAGYGRTDPGYGTPGPGSQPLSPPGRDARHSVPPRGSDPLRPDDAYGTDPLSRRDPGAARGSYDGRDSLAGRGPVSGAERRPRRDSPPGGDPLSGTGPRYGQSPSGRTDGYPQRDARAPRGQYPGQERYAPSGGQAYGPPGANPGALPDGGGRRQRRHGDPAGPGGQNGYRGTDSYGSPDGAAAAYGPRDARGQSGLGDEQHVHDPPPQPGAGDGGAFRWQPPPDSSRPRASGYPSVPDHEPPQRAPGDWDPGAEPRGPAGRRRRRDDSGAGFAEPGAGPGGREAWQDEEDEPAQWDEPPGRDGLIPGFGDRQDARRGRARRPGRRVGRAMAPALALLIALVVLAGLGFGGYKIYQHFQSPDYAGSGFGDVTVQVLAGDTAESLAPRLVSDGVVASTSSFVSAVKHSSDPTGLQPGFFRLHKHMKASLAYALLLNPKSRIQELITIPEGLRLTQILSKLEAVKSHIPSSAYAKAIKDTSALGLPSYANGKLEGYLFPATYPITPGMTATSVLQAMVTRFNQEAASVNLTSAAKAVHLTPGQVIIVASILEAEGGSPSYYSRVAEVIYNRLAAHWHLGLDSTVNYALHRFGISLTVSQLAVNSPYNTFTHFGLPPGPIDSPGDAAIQAALHPAHGNYMYFVTVNLKTGLTLFTNSASVFDHDVAICRANKAC
jgi:UPF0755 protein